jgi:hypothetical protein
MIKTRYADAARMFVMDASTTEMTVLRDDGIYRHLRFRRPDTGLYWFEIVTWPGSLCFHGDVGTWVFSRTTDMATFFGHPGSDINPGYWAEKVQAGETRRYSEDTASELVAEEFRQYADRHGWVLTSTVSLWEEISEQVLGEEVIGSEDLFRAAVRDFYWTAGPLRFGFSPDAYWDWDLRDFTAQFLWACFAVQWGVNQYRAARQAGQAPMSVPALPPVPQKLRDLADAVTAPPAPVPPRTGPTTKTAKEEYL